MSRNLIRPFRTKGALDEPSAADSGGPSTSRRLLASVATGALLAAALVPIMAAPANAALAGMGAVDPQTGYPTWYSDGTVKLQFCYMAGAGCLSEPPDATAPASYPDNFPEEAFWFNAEASGGNLGLYEAALEGAHLNGVVTQGEQMGFGRLRFIVDNLQPRKSYTITHPYGVNTFVAEQDPRNATLGRIKQTIDSGVCTPTRTAACDWAGVGEAFLGDYQFGSTATFLRQVGAAAGTLGDIGTARPVTGAPSGVNSVTVTGPDAGGPGVNTLTVSTFTVQGLIFDGADAAPTTPDLGASSDSGRSSTDNITNVTTPALTGTVPGVGQTEATVELLLDGANVPSATTTTVGGAYSLAPGTALPSAVHTARVRTANPSYSIDPATGAPVDPAVPQYLVSGTLTFTVDTEAPPVTIVSPFPSNPSADTTPTLNFSSPDASAKFECQLLPSNATWDPTCVAPHSYDQQLNDSYTFNVKANDAAGNVGAVASYSWRIGPLDTTAPTLTAQAPAANATGVIALNNVTATFSEAVTGASVDTFILTAPDGTTVPGVVTYDATARRATLNPTSTLSSNTRYVVTLTDGITDTSANPFAGATWAFTTADNVAPTVTTRTPAAGVTGVSGTGNITATFSESVQGVSGTTFTLADSAGSAVAGTVTYNATTRVATLDPAATLATGATYTATLTGGATAIRDTANNPLVTTSWSFTVAADTTAPTVTARAPLSGATGASRTANITATFSENVTGVSGTTFTLRNSAGTSIAATVTYDAATRVATLNPTADLALSTVYTATLTGGTTAIRDTANNPLVTTSWSFTVAADTTAPTVTARAPLSGATGASRTANITATFSENVTGVSGTTFTLRNSAGTAIAATVTYDAATRVATLNPTADLAPSTVYTATLTGGTTAIRDTANNPLVTTSWSFTSAADTTAPTVTARAPLSAATRVSQTGNVTATFSENVTGVSGTTFTLRNSAGTAIAATVTYDAATRVATLNPTSTLSANVAYTATLTGGATAIRDIANNPLVTTSWSFTTGDTIAPTITARTPGVSATAVSQTGNITVTFSENVTGVSGTTLTLKNAAGTTIPATVTYSATTRIATLDPTATLPADIRYTVALTGSATAIRDAAGNPLASTSWTFLTGPRPTVTARTPAVSATGVSRVGNVTATFSETVTGISATTVRLRSAAGTAITAGVTYNATTRVVTLDPSVTLAANTVYTATLTGSTTAIRDTAGNPLTTTSWSFTTGA